jgi:hypothetical protein
LQQLNKKANQRITNTDISLTRCLHIIYLKPNKLKLMKKSLLLMGMAVAAMTASAQETMTPLRLRRYLMGISKNISKPE